jgi:hypothetical protein
MSAAGNRLERPTTELCQKGGKMPAAHSNPFSSAAIRSHPFSFDSLAGGENAEWTKCESGSPQGARVKLAPMRLRGDDGEIKRKIRN